jgi:hypothetical protein
MTHTVKDGPFVEPDEDGHLHTYVFVNHSDTKIPVLLDALVKYRRTTFPRVLSVWQLAQVSTSRA